MMWARCGTDWHTTLPPAPPACCLALPHLHLHHPFLSTHTSAARYHVHDASFTHKVMSRESSEPLILVTATPHMVV